jgi:hypothetical protein
MDMTGFTETQRMVRESVGRICEGFTEVSLFLGSDQADLLWCYLGDQTESILEM